MVRGILAGMGILFLILDSSTALKGAQEGIELCLISVIPAIFPFLILTGALLPVVSSIKLPVGRILGVPGIYLSGLLGGYPTGAQMVKNAWDKKVICREDAVRMLAFCSNAGPSFIFGILGSKFPSIWTSFALWGIQILSSLMVAYLQPVQGAQVNANRIAINIPLSESLKTSVKTMGFICGWVILFRVILAFLDHWVLWLVPMSVRVAIYGILELANGCCSLDAIELTGLRFVLCSAMLSFGGFCVMMQTASVTEGLKLRSYIAGKLLQTFFSITFSLLIQLFLFMPGERLEFSPLWCTILMMFLLVFAIIRHKVKIRGRNPVKIGV